MNQGTCIKCSDTKRHLTPSASDCVAMASDLFWKETLCVLCVCLCGGGGGCNAAEITPKTVIYLLLTFVDNLLFQKSLTFQSSTVEKITG